MIGILPQTGSQDIAAVAAEVQLNARKTLESFRGVLFKRSTMAEWTEGVMGDGAVILKDGQPVPVDQVLDHINHIEIAIQNMRSIVWDADTVIEARQRVCALIDELKL